MTVTTLPVGTPCLDNYFCIAIETRGELFPYNRSAIKPFVPSDNQKLVILCESTYNQYKQTLNLNQTGALFYELKEPFVLTFAHLDPRDLARFSTVSKCCFLATKYPLIWETQLKKLLPDVNFISSTLCKFSDEQQFKIIFKRINDELKPYLLQLKKNNEVLNELRGSNGMNGAIDRAWKDYTHIGTTTKVWTNDGWQAYDKYTSLDRLRTCLAGNSYNGQANTIDSESQQGRLLKAINHDVHHAFNHQDQFDEIIRKSEAQTNVHNLTTDDVNESVVTPDNNPWKALEGCTQ